MPATLLSVNTYLYRRGGAEVVFQAHNEMFGKAGWQVVPFAMRHPKNISSEWDDYFVEEIEFGQPYGKFERVRKAMSAVYSFEARRKIRALAMRVEPDVCHAHNVYHHISPSIFSVVRSLGVPSVLTLHDLKLACPAYSMLSHDGVCERCRGGKLYNAALHRCMKGSLSLSLLTMFEAYLHRVLGSYRRNVDVFVVPSRFYRDKLNDWGFDDLDIRYVPNFIDTKAVKPSDSVGTRFLYFGRLSREKGVATLIRAARQAGVGLDIAGTGPDRAALEKVSIDTAADVRFLGFLAGSELERAVCQARAVVLPSEWYENGPLSMLEACAYAKPIVVASIGGLPELVSEGETGYAFESGSVDELAVILARLAGLGDAALRDMGQAGRERVAAEFSPEKYFERMMGIYSSLGVAVQQPDRFANTSAAAHR